MPTGFQPSAFQLDAFQIDAISGVLYAVDQNDTGSFVGSVETAPIIIIDTHDGGKQKKKFDAEKAKKDRQKQEIIDLYEQIVEGKPKLAAEIVEPYVKTATISEIKSTNAINIDFDSLINDLSRIQQLYDAHIEMDDEEVLALL